MLPETSAVLGEVVEHPARATTINASKYGVNIFMISLRRMRRAAAEVHWNQRASGLHCALVGNHMRSRDEPWLRRGGQVAIQTSVD